MSIELAAPTRSWRALLQEMARNWQRLDSPRRPNDPTLWPEQLKVLAAQMEALKGLGRWSSGPHDLLSIVGLNRWELAHSAALAWLCTPHAAHGLGARFLEALIAETGDAVSLTGPVEGRTEVSRAESRADVIVEGAGWVLVIEVKVDASEQPRQVTRLFNDWRDEGDVRFIFLTRTASPPTSAEGPADRAWVAVSWRRVRQLLGAAAESAQPSARARGALEEYLRTLDHTF